MKEEQLVSLIVPVYNVIEYLHDCIYSIINQTYKNLEIILVDDGSSDGCESLCDEFSKKDERIVVVHKKNGGLSDARNAGLNICKGEVIGFVDSDDYLDFSFVEQLLTFMNRFSADIVECNSVTFSDDQLKSSFFSQKYKCLSPQEWLTETNVGSFIPCVVWNKLYKKELFDGIRFPVGVHYEDEATTYKCVYNSSLIVRLQSALYFYRKRKGSITGNALNENEIIQKYNALKDKVSFFQSKGERRIASFCLAKLTILMISLFKTYNKLNPLNNWKDEIKNNYSFLKKEKIPIKYKLYMFLFYKFG